MFMGFIAAVINNKGGVGKTTVACNLAHALALEGKRVLVVDLDSQCNATALLMPAGNRPRSRQVYELLEQDRPGENVQPYFHPTRYEQLFCLPNVPETAALEPRLILGAPDSFFRLRRHLRDQVRACFDVAIIDTPPNLGAFVLCALNAADFALVPVKSGSAFSIEGLVKAVRLIKEVQEQSNRDLRFLRLLINQLDKRTLISRTLAAQITEAFRKDQVFRTLIPAGTAFEKAEAAGKTLLSFRPRAPGALAFRELARELLDIPVETIESRRTTACKTQKNNGKTGRH
jgi:cellulose biosynthesis protein BcsQ